MRFREIEVTVLQLPGESAQTPAKSMCVNVRTTESSGFAWTIAPTAAGRTVSIWSGSLGYMLIFTSVTSRIGSVALP